MQKNKENISKIEKDDLKLLLELFNDGRESFSQLGKKCLISKEVVRYKYLRLKEIKIIKKIVPIIDFFRIGLNLYRLQIKFEPIDENQKNIFIEYLKSLNKIILVDEVYGKWDLVIHFYLKNNKEFDLIYDDLIEKHGELIEEKLFTIITNISYFPPNYLLENSNREEIKIGNKYSNLIIDENQNNIILKLFEDGRQNLVNIADKLETSINNIKYHMKELQKKEILIKTIPIINSKKLGFEHFNIKLELLKPNEKKKLINQLKSNLNVVQIIESLGKYDLEFDCEFEKVHNLIELINNIRKEIKIKDYEILFDNDEILNEIYLKKLN